MGADVDIAEAFLELGAATLGESGGRAMRSRIAPMWHGARVAAPAFTVRCTPADNLAVHVAVASAPEGSVLVVDVGEVRELGYWGEVLTTGAEARGLAGLVIDGGVRDTAEVEIHRFPVFAAMVALRGATKSKPGAVNVAVRCGGVAVDPGDWVVGDADGVVVVPGVELDAVLHAGRARAEQEQQMFSELFEGRTTLELLNLDASPVQVDQEAEQA